MIREIALTRILGLPLVVYGGIMTFLLFSLAAFIGYTNHNGKKIIPFKWHKRVVVISFTFAFIHAFFALSIFVRF